MSRTVIATGNNIRSAVSAARKLMGVTIKGYREVSRSGSGDGLYRVTLQSGDIVEVTIKLRTPATAVYA